MFENWFPPVSDPSLANYFHFLLNPRLLNFCQKWIIIAQHEYGLFVLSDKSEKYFNKLDNVSSVFSNYLRHVALVKE